MNAIREVLTPERIRDIACTGHPMLQWIARDETFAGSHFLIRVDPNSPYTSFMLTRVCDFERVPFTGKEMPHPLIERTSQAIRALGDRLSKGLFVGGRAKDLSGNQQPGVSGLTEWLCVPTPKSWYGVDRTQDCVRLAGHMLSGRGRLVHEALAIASRATSFEGCPADAISWMHPSMFERLLAEKPPRLTAVTHQGVKCALFESGGEPVFAAQDPDCPEREAFRIPYGAFGLASLGPVPQLLDDGVQMEVRLGMFGNTFVSRPAHCARITELGQ